MLLDQGWANILTFGPQGILKFGTNIWSFLVIYLIREINNLESGCKDAFILIGNYFKTDLFSNFTANFTNGLKSIKEKCKLIETLHSCDVRMIGKMTLQLQKHN